MNNLFVDYSARRRKTKPAMQNFKKGHIKAKLVKINTEMMTFL